MPAALLDTNAVSDLMRDHPKVKARVGQQPHQQRKPGVCWFRPAVLFGRNTVDRFFTPREIQDLLELLHTLAA